MFDADPKARMSLDYVPDSDVRRARLIPSKDSFARVAAGQRSLLSLSLRCGHDKRVVA